MPKYKNLDRLVIDLNLFEANPSRKLVDEIHKNWLPKFDNKIQNDKKAAVFGMESGYIKSLRKFLRNAPLKFFSFEAQEWLAHFDPNILIEKVEESNRSDVKMSKKAFRVAINSLKDQYRNHSGIQKLIQQLLKLLN